MPTGYTYIVEKGATFEEYVWRCARAFGATVLMRDEPMDKPITEEMIRDGGGFYEERLRNAQSKLKELEGMSEEQVEALCEAEYKAEVESFEGIVAKNAGLKAKYEHMLQQVDAWEPPTEDHKSFKEFMQQQLRESIKFDIYEPAAPEKYPPKQWHAMQLSDALRDIKRAKEEIEKSKKRNEERLGWVNALRESVPQATFKED